MIADHSVAIVLVMLSMAGALRVTFSLGYTLYYLSASVLAAVALSNLFCALRKCKWDVTASNLLSALGLRKRVAIYLLLYWSLFGWLIISTLWTSASETAWKEDLFYIVFLLCIGTLTALSITRRTPQKFLIYWVIGAALLTSFVLKGTITAENYREYRQVFKGVYLVFATPQGVAFAISFFYFILSTSKTLKTVWFLLSAWFLAGVGHSLSRGSLLFSMLSISIVLFVYFWHYQDNFWGKIKKIGTYVLAGAVMFSGMVFMALNVKWFASRLNGLTDFPVFWKKNRGGLLWEPAWEHIKESPIWGHGLGMNSVYPPLPRHHYPHNLFLQVWLDGGIFAVLMLSVLLLWPLIFMLKRIKYDYSDPTLCSLCSVLIILVLDFSKSYDFYTGISLVVVSILSFSYAATDDDGAGIRKTGIQYG